jgi:hypothetical protein
MVASDNRRPTVARGPMRRDQRRRIDLESPVRLRCNIAARSHRIKPFRRAEEQAAHLLFGRICGLV